jgi:hypothetical protein
MFIGGYFLRLLGTIVIYFYEMTISFFKWRKPYSFKEVWNAPYNDDFFRGVSAELLQKMLGFLFIVLILIIIHFF